MGKNKLKTNHSHCTKEAVFTYIGAVLALIVMIQFVYFVIDRILDAYLCGVVFQPMFALSTPCIIILPTSLCLQQFYPWLSSFWSPVFFWDVLFSIHFNPDCIFKTLTLLYSVYGLGSLLYLLGIHLAS